eukprot:1036176_1
MTHNADFCSVEKFLLDVSNQNIDDFSSFALSIFAKGCYSKYPLNIACMKHIRKFRSKTASAIRECLDNEIVPQILDVLKQNDDNLYLLCSGYVRQFIIPNYIPTDVIDMLATTFCTVQCVTELHDEGLSIIQSIMQRPLPNCFQHWCDHGLVDILMKQRPSSLQTKSNTIIALHSLYLWSPSNAMLKQSLFQCLNTFRRILTASDPPPTESFLDGLVSRLMHFTHSDAPLDLQFESLWIIVNLTWRHAAYFVKYLSLFPFVALLKSPWYQIQEQAVWILGNIGSEFEKDEFTTLTYSVNNPDAFDDNHCFEKVLRITSWTLSVFCRYLPSLTLQEIYHLIECLHCLLNRTYEGTSVRNEIINHVAFGLRSLIAKQEEFQEEAVDRMLENGIVEQLIALIGIDDSNTNVDQDMRLSILKLIGNISIGADRHVTECLRLGILNKYYNILSGSPTEKETYEISWTISNFAAGPLNHTLQLLNSKLFPILFKLLKTASYKVRKNVLWILSNSMHPRTKRTATVMNAFLELDIMDAIIVFLRSRDYDDHVASELDVAISCVANVLVFAKERLSDDYAETLCLKWKENGVIVDYVKVLRNAVDAYVADNSLDVSDVIETIELLR